MKDRLIFIGTFEIPQTALAEWRTRSKEMYEFVQANEPRVLSFHFYVSADGREGTVIQVYPDSEALEYHLKVAAAKIEVGSQMVKVKHLQLFGSPSERLVEQLRRGSELGGGWPVIVKGYVHGFSRGESDVSAEFPTAG